MREEKELPAEEKGQSSLAKRIEAGFYAPSPAKTKALRRTECVEPVIALSTKGLRKTRLAFEEKVGVLHKVFVRKEYQSNIAREYKVTPATICSLAKKFRTDKQWFVNLQRRREAKAARRAIIRTEVCKCLEELAFIDSAHYVVSRLEGSGLEKLKDVEVASVMKHDVGLRFRKVVATNPRCNSERSLVLRQQFALRLISWFQDRPRLINVDESWLGMADFRRTKWLPADVPKTTTKAILSPRVSFLVALDNHGEVYWALNQGNSNADVMCLFLRALVTRLN
jgi:plasmid maintenance system antidote protein VapI